MAKRKASRSNKDIDEIVPKKKWNTLGEVKDYLEQAKVKIEKFNGYQLVTDKHAYGIVDSILCIIPKEQLVPDTDLTQRLPSVRPKPKKVEKIKIEKKPKAEILAQIKARGEKLLKKKTQKKKKRGK